MGGEAYTVLRDVCQLDPDDAIAIANWSARALLVVHRVNDSDVIYCGDETSGVAVA